MNTPIYTALKRACVVAAMAATAVTAAWAQEQATNVAKIGDTEYATLREAFHAATAGQTVELMTDITVASTDDTCVIRKQVTLNMASHTLTSSVQEPLYVTDNGDLTITGSGTITGPTGTAGQALDGYAVITVNGSNAKLTYLNGTLTCGGVGSDGMYGIYVLNGGTATFGEATSHTGPSITSWFACIGENNTTAPATITIHGGNYTQEATPSASDWWHYFCAPVYAAASGTVTIDGGTFSGKYAAVASRYDHVNQTITILDGTFTGVTKALYLDNQPGVACEQTRSVVLKGGTFSSNDNLADYLAQGYVVNQNGSLYTVERIVVAVETNLPEGASTEQQTAATELVSNPAISGEDATDVVEKLGEGSSLEIKLTAVTVESDNVTSATFDVTPKNASGEEEHNPSNPITFRLPVSSGIAADTWVNLKHNTTPIQGTTVVADGDNRYISITTSSFSTFAYEIVETPVAQIGQIKYDNIATAISAAGTTQTTITFLADISDGITIPNNAKITLEVGSFTYSGTITNNGTCVLSGGTYTNLPPVNCCVGYIPVKKTGDKYQLVNSWTIADTTVIANYSYLANKGYSVATAKYIRKTGMVGAGTNAGTTYGTLCLPFSITYTTESRNIKFYKATAVSTSTLTITEVTITEETPIAAGTPLIFELKTAAKVLTLTSTNATINTDAPATASTSDNLLVGTYTTQTINSGLENIYYLNGDKFHQAVVSLTVPAYRAYIEYTAPAGGGAPERLEIRKAGEEATGVEEIFAGEAQIEAVYDAMGRKLDGLQQGMNIVRYSDGRTLKVIVK